MAMAAQLCKHTKNHWLAHFKKVNLVIRLLHFNKVTQKS